jgi:hypothetical protein
VVVFDIRLLDDPLGLSAVAPRSPPAPLGLPTFRPTLPSPSSALLPAGLPGRPSPRRPTARLPAGGNSPVARLATCAPTFARVAAGLAAGSSGGG